jgi:hypothetical protein
MLNIHGYPRCPGSANDTVLALVVITALGFDFTNGFHDTGNAMATSIATGALPPRIAVAVSGVLNFAGAFLSLAVAATIASGLVDTKVVTLTVVAAGLAGGIIWNLLTWLLGIPSSSSHALIGGVVGSTLAAAGGSAVLWHGLVSKVVLPAVHGLAGTRHQRCSEDHGRHHARADRQRHARQGIQRADLGDRVLRARDQYRHLCRRLARHPHPGQGPGGNRVAAGHGRRVGLGGGHSAVQQLRLFAVHHARRHRLDHRHRARQEGRGSPVERRGPDGHGLGVHAALCRAGRRCRVRPRARRRRHRGSGARPDRAGRFVGADLPPVPVQQGGPQQHRRRRPAGDIGWGVYEVYQIGHPPVHK